MSVSQSQTQFNGQEQDQGRLSHGFQSGGKLVERSGNILSSIERHGSVARNRVHGNQAKIKITQGNQEKIKITRETYKTTQSVSAQLGVHLMCFHDHGLLNKNF